MIDIDLDTRPRHPVDPTRGELALPERRVLVRRLADVVGKAVAARVKDARAAGRVISGDAEKVASVTTLHHQLDEFNRSRVAAGVRPLSDDARAAIVDAVIAHVYGLGELDELWG